MENPRFIPLTSDDTLWVYDTDDIQPLINGNLEQWYDETINPLSNCPRPDSGLILKSMPQGPTGYAYQVVGVCGTPLVLVAGLEQATSKPQAGGLVELEKPQGFWDWFEQALSTQPGQYGGIEFFFLTKEMQLYVHLQLGRDHNFALQYLNGVVSQSGYAQWMLYGSSTQGCLIDRTFWTVDSNGNKTPLDVSKITFALDDANVQTTEAGTQDMCPADCCYLACGVTACYLSKFEPDSGTVIGSVDMALVKTYCDDCHGGPCL
ncbi:MAG: hypothetical protein JST51_10050 [Armatimonadetes bacterium]|nr:hypothetical protein [Armatimonadota bacterium]